MAKNLAAGAQQQAGAGGPVKTGPAAKPDSGSAAAHAASIHSAHATESAPGQNLSKAASHIGK